MSSARHWLRAASRLAATLTLASLAGCGFHGANSFPLPGTQGAGEDSFTVRAQMPDVQNLERNSRVRVNDVTVGKVTDIQLQGWHALVTMTVNGDVDLPANVTATIGQTSLLGSVHVELGLPTDRPPEGKLKDGSVIPLSSATTYPSTERTLAALSMLLNGGGIGHVQDITEAFSTAFTGRELDLRSLLEQLDKFVGYLDHQKDDIIAATESLNNLAGQFSEQKPVVDKALRTIPNALAVLKDQRQNIADALAEISKFGALATDSVNNTKENLVKELNDLGPVLQSLGDAGPALTRSLGFYGTFPFPKDNIEKFQRGDYANVSVVVDLTLSRVDAALFTGTRWEGDLTELEMQWGRTIGQQPSPYTAANPLLAPYRFDQGR